MMVEDNSIPNEDEKDEESDITIGCTNITLWDQFRRDEPVMNGHAFTLESL